MFASTWGPRDPRRQTRPVYRLSGFVSVRENQTFVAQRWHQRFELRNGNRPQFPARDRSSRPREPHHPAGQAVLPEYGQRRIPQADEHRSTARPSPIREGNSILWQRSLQSFETSRNQRVGCRTWVPSERSRTAGRKRPKLSIYKNLHR